MALIDVLTRTRRIPSSLVGVLGLIAAGFSPWLAVGPAVNLRGDDRQIDAFRKDAPDSMDEIRDIERRFKEAGDDKRAMQLLLQEMKLEHERSKRPQAEPEAREIASIRRRRWGYAGFSGLFIFPCGQVLPRQLSGHECQSQRELQVLPMRTNSTPHLESSLWDPASVI